MSDIPRYKPVPDDRFGIADDADGKLCEYRHYEQLKSTVQSFAANVLRLGNEVRDLADENKELHKDYESLADEHTKLIDRYKTLKAEVERLKMEESKLLTLCETYEGDLERLRASSFVTAVPVEEYEKLKAENERLRKDSEYERMYREVIEVLKEGKQP